MKKLLIAGLTAAMAAISMLRAAADETTLFSPSDKDKQSAIDKIAVKYGKKDASEQAPYRQVIAEVFKIYFADPAVMSAYDSDSEKQLKDSAKVLTDSVSFYDKRCRNLAADLDRAREAAMEKAAKDSLTATARTDSVKKVTAALEKELADMLKANADLEASVKAMKDSTVSLNLASMDLDRKIGELTGELARSEGIKSSIDDRKSSAADVAAAIEANLKAMQATPVLKVTDAPLKASEKLFADNKSLLSSYAPEQMAQAQSCIDRMREITEAAAVAKEAVKMLDEKYNSATNAGMIAKVKGAMRMEGPSDMQTMELKELGKALEMHGSAVDAFKAGVDAITAGDYMDMQPDPADAAQRARYEAAINALQIGGYNYKKLADAKAKLWKVLVTEKSKSVEYDADKMKKFLDEIKKTI